MDDFGVKHVGKKHAKHLIDALKKTYQITMNWDSSEFCGMNLKWDYKKRTYGLNMSEYVKKQLDEFKYPNPGRP